MTTDLQKLLDWVEAEEAEAAELHAIPSLPYREDFYWEHKSRTLEAVIDKIDEIMKRGALNVKVERSDRATPTRVGANLTIYEVEDEDTSSILGYFSPEGIGSTRDGKLAKFMDLLKRAGAVE